MANEAKIISSNHQKWMIELLKSQGGHCNYAKLVEQGEKEHCDTVGAMLKILKRKKVITFDQVFLMYPDHKNEIITLLNPDFDPFKQ